VHDFAFFALFSSLKPDTNGLLREYLRADRGPAILRLKQLLFQRQSQEEPFAKLTTFISLFNYSTLICSECRCECVVLVCISCAENQQCALEFTISSCKTRKYGNEKGKQKGGSKCSFFRVSFKVFLGSIKVATSRHKEEERRKKGGWVSISVVLFVLFVLHMFLLVGLGYCPFLDPITYMMHNWICIRRNHGWSWYHWLLLQLHGGFFGFFSKEGCYIVLGRQMVGKSSMFLQSSVSSRSSVFVYNCVVFSKSLALSPGWCQKKASKR